MRPEPIIPESAAGPTDALADARPAIHRVHRGPRDIHPVPLLGALGAAAAVLAIILLAAGSLVVGLILLGLAVASFTLFFGGVVREPDAPAAASILRAANRISSLRGLAAVELRAWGRAGLELARVRRRQLRLRKRVKAGLAPLGEAVHQGDRIRAQVLREQISAAEGELAELERHASAVTRAARAKVEHERETLQRTQSFGRVEEPT